MIWKLHAIVVTLLAVARQALAKETMTLTQIPDDFEANCPAPLEDEAMPVWLLSTDLSAPVGELYRLSATCADGLTKLILPASEASQNFRGALIYKLDDTAGKWAVQYEEDHQVRNAVIGGDAAAISDLATDEVSKTQLDMLVRLLSAGKLADSCDAALKWYDAMTYTIANIITNHEKTFIQEIEGVKTLEQSFADIMSHIKASGEANDNEELMDESDVIPVNYSVSIISKLNEALKGERDELSSLCAQNDLSRPLTDSLKTDSQRAMLERIQGFGFVLSGNKIHQKF